MKYDVLYNFISPVTGKMHLPKGYIFVGDENNLTSPSDKLIVLQSDFSKLSSDLSSLKKLPKDYILIGNKRGDLIASPILIDIRLDLMQLYKRLYFADENITSILRSSFIIKTKNELLKNAQVLSDLGTGLLKNNDSNGNLVIASGGKDLKKDDYVRPIDLNDEIEIVSVKVKTAQETADSAMGLADAAPAAGAALANTYFHLQMLPYIPSIPLIGGIGAQITAAITAVEGTVIAANKRIDNQKKYIDDQDEKTLTTSKDYADQKGIEVLDRANKHSDENDTKILEIANKFTSDEVLVTLQSAKDYTDTQDKAILESANKFVTEKAGEALTNSKAYTDSKFVEANTYTDDVTAKILNEVNKHSDDNDKVTLFSANNFSQNLVAESLQVGKDYTDSKLDGIKTELTKSVSDGCAKAVKDAAQYSDKQDTVTLKNANDYTDSKNWKTLQVIDFKEEVIALIKSEVRDNPTVDIDERIKLQMEFLAEQMWLEKLLILDEVF